MNLSFPVHRIVIVLFLLISWCSVLAQKEPVIWYFGDHNGIDFRSGGPVAISNPNISYQGAEIKGVATVTDASGNLLFYAEGETVYNNADDTMQNGSGMPSGYHSAQAGLTVRAIHDTTIFYLFNAEMMAGPTGVSYSIIDMKENNGLGAVTTKIAPLFASATTQLCAIRHCNERDIWVIAHEWNSDAYYAFLVTSKGVSTTPVISRSGRHVGQPQDLSNTFGYMKVSPDGKKIAASYRMSGVDLSDFDNATGIVSNTIDLQFMHSANEEAYGVEFSPDSRLLYTNSFDYPLNSVYQYDVYAGSPAAIIATRVQLVSIYFHGYFSSMQRGPDDQLYVACYGQRYVSIIHKPDARGVACDFELGALPLIERSSHGFPAYVESKYYPEPPFTFSVVCPAQKLSFEYDKPDNIISVKWDFGDPSSGNANTSTELNPVHEFSAEGTYKVKLIRFLSCNTDTLEEDVSVKKFSVDLGNDTTICSDKKYYLNPVTSNNVGYLWQDGSSSINLLVNTSGLYWLQITDQVTGCSMSDTVLVYIHDVPDITLGPDTVVCDNAVMVLDAGNQGYDYTWQDGSKSNSFDVKGEGLYIVTATNGYCTVKDSVQIRYNKTPAFSLGEDQEFCAGDIINLGSNLSNIYTYVWEDGSTSVTKTVTRPGTFQITGSNECGSFTDEINIWPGDCILAVPNAFTPDGDGKNDVFAVSKTIQLPSFSMQIFNRWGQKIFESRDQSKGWNGTQAGRTCDPGNYPYVIHYRTVDGAPVVLKGVLLLIR